MNANKRSLDSDFAKTDARGITDVDYEEIPELGDDFFEKADVHHGGVLVKRGRGRPPGSNKEQINLRIDHDVIDAYKAQGDGWQTRMNEALRNYAKLQGLMS